MTRADTIALFDLDGTLSEPRQKCSTEMLAFLKELRSHIQIGVVSGSDLPKLNEQMGGNSQEIFDYVLSENGVVAFKGHESAGADSMAKFLGEDKLKKFINFVLKTLSEVDCPVKRGTFVEYRMGMLNISPVGRSCSQKERDEFFEFDKKTGLRKKLVEIFTKEFGQSMSLQFSIGGQISIDVFPVGWDKTYCLRRLDTALVAKGNIHFFGDKTDAGGNDHEIYVDKRVKGHSVKSPADTMRICRELFLSASK